MTSFQITPFIIPFIFKPHCILSWKSSQRSWGFGKQESLDSGPAVPHLRFAHLPLFIPPLQIKGAHEEETKSQKNWGVCGKEGEKGSHAPGPCCGGGHLWADCTPALGAFCWKIKWTRSQRLLLPLLLPPWLTTHMACCCRDQGMSE